MKDGANEPPADAIVKVPQMAESITEGTLKQFSKSGFFPFCILLPIVLLTVLQVSAIMLNATRNWRLSRPIRCVRWFSVLDLLRGQFLALKICHVADRY